MGSQRRHVSSLQWASGFASALGHLEFDTGSRGLISTIELVDEVRVVAAGERFVVEPNGGPYDTVRAWVIRHEIRSLAESLPEGRRQADFRWTAFLQDMAGTAEAFEGWSLDGQLKSIARTADSEAQVELRTKWGATTFLIDLQQAPPHVGHDMAANLIDGNPGTVDWR